MIVIKKIILCFFFIGICFGKINAQNTYSLKNDIFSNKVYLIYKNHLIPSDTFLYLGKHQDVSFFLYKKNVAFLSYSKYFNKGAIRKMWFVKLQVKNGKFNIVNEKSIVIQNCPFSDFDEVNERSEEIDSLEVRFNTYGLMINFKINNLIKCKIIPYNNLKFKRIEKKICNQIRDLIAVNKCYKCQKSSK